MSDLNKILAAEQANRNDHSWAVAFTVRLHDSLIDPNDKPEPCPDCGKMHEDSDVHVIADSIVVGCGDDAQVAIERVKQHVVQEHKFGVKINPDSFKLKGVKLLSVQEI